MIKSCIDLQKNESFRPQVFSAAGSFIGCAVQLYSTGKHLYPVGAVGSAFSVSNPQLFHVGVENIGAVSIGIHPGFHDFFGGTLAGSDVFRPLDFG